MLEVSGYKFAYICRIQPEMDGGEVRTFEPQDRYANESELGLHDYGGGPFCKFRIPREYRYTGVYLLTVDESKEYVGECRDLVKRFNSGYGQISPRNCFVGGRRTNCRVNNLIYKTLTAGKTVILWFLQTNDYKVVEAELISDLQPIWNRKGIRK
jgi:hypothetical protein